MNDVRTQVMPFSTDSVWSMLPSAYDAMRETLNTVSTERLAAVAAEAMPMKRAGYTMNGNVAVVPFTGVVSKRQTLMGRIFGGQAITTEFRAALQAAEADPAVKSILAVIDSPGGTVEGTADAADTFALCQKPTAAYIEDLGASAAYWIASQADKVVCNSTAVVGSIGVFATMPDMSRLAKNMGVDVHVVRSAAGKGAGTPGTTVTDSQLAEMQKRVNAIHGQFVAAVSAGRQRDMAPMADGSVLVGQAAVDAGLVDAVQPLADTIAAMQQVCCPGCCPNGCGPDCACTDCTDPSCSPTCAQPAAAAAIVQEETIMAETETPKTPDYAAQIAALTTANEATAKELTEMKRSDVIAKGVADRKLTPALVKAAAAMPYDTLVAWIADLPVSAPAGGSVTEPKADAPIPAAGAPHPSDFVGQHLEAYEKETAGTHQAAITYMTRSEKAGHKVSYTEAVLATTRKTA